MIMKKVKINDTSTKKLYNYVNAIKEECGGFLVGERDIKKGSYEITDVIFLRLNISKSAEFEIDDEAIFEFMKDSPELSSKVIGWWHTHPSFSTFFSSVDENTFKILNSMFKLPIGVVINKYNDWYWAYMDNKEKLIDLKNIETSNNPMIYKMDNKLISEAKEKVNNIKVDDDIKVDDNKIYNIAMENMMKKNKVFTIPLDVHNIIFKKIIKDNNLSKGDKFLYDDTEFEVL